MLSASSYTPLYHHVMLLVVLGCALFWTANSKPGSIAQFNQVVVFVLGLGVVLFMGLRPISGVFVDMLGYASAYEIVQDGGTSKLPDRLFDGLMQLCAPALPAQGFFLVCSVLYVAPLAVAFWRVHGSWAAPVFLASLTAFSFWFYGVNGIRNGMATSLLITGFAFHDKPLVMFPLMAAACGFHGATILPAGAFLLVRYLKWTELWLAFWFMCVAVSLFAGNVGEMLLSRFNPFAWDNRLEDYLLNSGQSGFRADFLAYSIIPILVTLLLAAPPRARFRLTLPRLKKPYTLNWMRNQTARAAEGMVIPRLVCFEGTSAVAVDSDTLGSGYRDPRRGWEGRRTMLTGKEPSLPQAKHKSWNSLPWGGMLRSDPFYARLVNTYFLANSLWVLVIHANYSNRFAYLSWFMMPWILLYPFVPGKAIHRPRKGLLAAILCAHYMFTYVMVVVVYRLRGIL